jgi:hypothetical protein
MRVMLLRLAASFPLYQDPGTPYLLMHPCRGPCSTNLNLSTYIRFPESVHQTEQNSQNPYIPLYSPLIIVSLTYILMALPVYFSTTSHNREQVELRVTSPVLHPINRPNSLQHPCSCAFPPLMISALKSLSVSHFRYSN